MNLIRFIIVTILLVFSLSLFPQESNFENFLRDCQIEVGTWIADNAEYKSDNEPYDAYGMEWKWGVGQKSLTGRLYAIKDGKDIGSLFQFRRYWDATHMDEKEVNTDTLIEQMKFMVGKWKAIAADSSFSSVLEYQYSPEKKLLMATNHLYGKNGQKFASYEGAYLVEDGTILYIIAGPKGETHRGKAIVAGNTITHMANIYPGKGTKSYRSEMTLKDGKLFYYASYSKESKIPDSLSYDNPLVYCRM